MQTRAVTSRIGTPRQTRAVTDRIGTTRQTWGVAGRIGAPHEARGVASRLRAPGITARIGAPGQAGSVASGLRTTRQTWGVTNRLRAPGQAAVLAGPVRAPGQPCHLAGLVAALRQRAEPRTGRIAEAARRTELLGRRRHVGTPTEDRLVAGGIVFTEERALSLRTPISGLIPLTRPCATGEGTGPATREPTGLSRAGLAVT